MAVQVVDMLTRRIAGNQIAGIILMNAHRVSDTSQDGFAVRLFRTSNKDGFLRAFSDQPISFTAGFAKVGSIWESCAANIMACVSQCRARGMI